ncbi:O-antigen ligase family protein [Roseovarius sp. S4756]|uniref:O-antigen ligase family protein n=1 Tax=Roseovarius maritimus TaxID=3342637 RepID=UPI003726C514
MALVVVFYPIWAAAFSLPRWLQVAYVVAPVLVAIPVLTALVVRALRISDDPAVPILSLLLITSQLNGIGAGPLDLFDAALLGAFGIWAARIATDSERALRLSPLFFGVSLLVVLGIAHLPVISPVTWFIGIFGIVRVAILTLMVVDLCRTLATLRVFSSIFIAVAVVSALIGMLQFALAYFQVFYFSLIDPLQSAFKPTPIGFVMRASGLCSTAQHFSSFMVYALPFALWQASLSRRWWDFLFILIILGGLAVSLNFGGIFAGALALSLFPLLRWPSLILHFVLIGTLFLGLAYFAGLLDVVYDMSFGDAGIAKGVDQRKTLFELGLEQVGRAPLIGTGLHGFGEVDGNFWDRPVHNMFGQAATELGVMGALVCIGIFFALTLDLGRLVLSDKVRSRFPAVLLMVLLAALLLAQNEPNLQHSNLWLMLAVSQSVILIARSGQLCGRRSDQKIGQDKEGESHQR